MEKKEYLGNKYVPEYAGNYFSKPWYERDLMGYFDYLDYQEMSNQPTKYFEQKKVINFDIIHHESRGDPLQGSYKGYQTEIYTWEKKGYFWFNSKYKTKWFVCR